MDSADVRVPDFPQDPRVRDLTLALNYVCNSRCRFCFIEPEIAHGYPDTPTALVDEVFRKNKETSAFERIIFSGAEATLRKDFPDIVSRAKSEGGFRHVRVQTNGRRMESKDYCERLTAAGLDEYFVSIHASNAELDAEVTGSRHSFEQMRAGIANILASGARLISNTCVTSDNVDDLPDLARFLLAEGVRESQIWAFVEFGDVGQEHQHVPFSRSIPRVREAASILLAGGNRASLSWFPRCLLGEHAPLLENHRAFTLILDEFTQRMHKHAGFSCVFADECAHFARSCVGLHERYVELFGNEGDRLSPESATPEIDESGGGGQVAKSNDEPAMKEIGGVTRPSGAEPG